MSNKKTIEAFFFEQQRRGRPHRAAQRHSEISHRRKTPTHDTCRANTATFNENGPVRAGTLCHRKMATSGMGNKKIAKALGVPEGVAAPVALGGLDGVAQRLATMRRGGWFVCLVFAISSHISGKARCVWFSR